jgi:6-phosphogluconolactonase
MYGGRKMQLRSFGEADLLTSDLALQLKHILNEAITKRGQAYLVVSGGKTPIDLFRILAKTELPWDKVTIILADERCVPITDSHRNERLVKEFLLQHLAAKANFLSIYDEQIELTEGLYAIEQVVAALPTFDAVVLGMGEDGHTASLFPCAAELSFGLTDPAAMLLVNPKKAPFQRISLSKKRLLDSRTIFLHLQGQHKLTVLHKAMAEPNPMLMPVSAFLNNAQANIQVMYAP